MNRISKRGRLAAAFLGAVAGSLFVYHSGTLWAEDPYPAIVGTPAYKMCEVQTEPCWTQFTCDLCSAGDDACAHLWKHDLARLQSLTEPPHGACAREPIPSRLRVGTFTAANYRLTRKSTVHMRQTANSGA